MPLPSHAALLAPPYPYPQAILMSGNDFSLSLADATRAGDRLAESVGCADGMRARGQTRLECLRQLDSQMLINEQVSSMSLELTRGLGVPRWGRVPSSQFHPAPAPIPLSPPPRLECFPPQAPVFNISMRALQLPVADGHHHRPPPDNDHPQPHHPPPSTSHRTSCSCTGGIRSQSRPSTGCGDSTSRVGSTEHRAHEQGDRMVEGDV